MAMWRAGTLQCAVLTASLAATGAQAKARTPRASAPATTAPAVPAPAAYVAAPRRTQPPALALKPEFSEGEWSEFAGADQLDPAALASSSAPVGVDGGRLATARVGSTLAKISERQLAGAPVATSRLDQPIGSAPAEPVPMPQGLSFSPSGFTVNSAANN
jgi:hypothetical protein